MTASPVQPLRHRVAAVEMLVGAVVGLIASFVLSVDALALAANPDAVFSCDINAKISCGTVGQSWQAELFGFPNSFLGLMSEPVVITVAVALLAWGGRSLFPRWFMIAAQGVYTLGFTLAVWLFYQSYFVIGALCPWCLTITVTTLLVWMSLTRINVLDGNFGERIRRIGTPLLRVYKGDLIVTVLAVAVIAGFAIQYL